MIRTHVPSAFAIAPLGIVLKILFLGVGWVVAFPRFKSTQFTVPELLKDLYDSHSLEYSIYAAELCNMAHYFQQKLNGQAAEDQQKYVRLDKDDMLSGSTKRTGILL